jgi:Skp family chaperone for outer membrane proteins
VKRTMLLLGALVALGLGLYLTGQVYAQSPGATSGTAPVAAAKPTRTDPTRVAVFNVVKVMKDFQKWQYYAITMNNKRITAAGELGKLRNEIVELQQKAGTEPRKDVQDQLGRTMVEKQRTFEDLEKQYSKTLNEESAAHLKSLYIEIQRAVASIVESNGYDVVFAYPDGTTAEEMASPTVLDMKIRPQFAMPFYVSKSADVTDTLIGTLNKYFVPPGAIPAAMTVPVTGPVVPTAGQR